MKEKTSKNDDLDSLVPEADARNNNSLPQEVNIYLMTQEIDDTLLRYEPFIENSASNEFQNVTDDIKTIMKQIIQENSKISCREDLLETRNYTILQFMNLDNSEPLDFVKQELDEIVKHEPIIKEDISTDFLGDTEHIKPFTNQIIEEDGKIGCREDSTETWNNFLPQDVNIDNPYNTALLDLVEQELDDNLLKLEPFIEESTSNAFYSVQKDIKTTMKQIIEENTNIWCRGDLLEKRNKFSIKYQENDDFSATDESTAPIITDIGCECKTSRTDIIDRKTNHTYASEGNTLQNPGSRDCSPQPSDDSDRLKRKIHKCHLCDFRTYQQESSLQRHIDIVHLKINDRICPFCDFHASNKWCLREHMHSVHLKLKNFKCHICYFSTSHKRFLQRHINSFHLRSEDRAGFKEGKLNHNRIKSALLNVKGYKCPKCEFAISKKRTLENNSHAVNSNSTIHELTKCDFQNSIQNHMNYGYEERKTYECYSCDYSSSEKRILRRHIISVHLKLKNHKCQRCDFRSSSKSNLQKHVNAVHFKQKNHECQFCNFRAFLKTSVQEHENAVHFKVMNHKCHLCKYVTSRRGGLLKHIYAIHSSVQKQKNYLCDYKFFTT